MRFQSCGSKLIGGFSGKIKNNNENKTFYFGLFILLFLTSFIIHLFILFLLFGACQALVILTLLYGKCLLLCFTD